MSSPHLIYPLNEFYERSGVPVPPAARIEPQSVPEPYRGFLVNERDMTPALEDAYDRNIQLHVLEYELAGDVFSRQVVLVPEGYDSPAAFGAIRIHLEHFPPEARRLILERKQPLGTILRHQRVEHSGRIEAYLRITADPVIHGALRLDRPCQLYGRRKSILGAAQETLAQVVEILPPSNGISYSERKREQR